MAQKADVSDKIQKLLGELRAFRETPDSYALDLRMSLAQVVLAELRSRQWGQKELAEATGRAESFVSRTLSGDSNWTTDTAGAFLCALGARARVVLCPTSPSGASYEPIDLIRTEVVSDDEALKRQSSDAFESGVSQQSYEAESPGASVVRDNAQDP